MKSKEQNLGTGNIGKLIISLAVPAVISQIVNMLYNIIDRMYIGHIPVVGVQALTGLGLCFPIIMIVSAFSSLLGMGGAPRAAICMGKKDNDGAEKILGNCTAALVINALVLMIVLLIFGEKLLFLFGASNKTINYAWDYLSIYAIGTVFVQISLGLNMFITTQGFAKYSMFTIVIGAVINIILDPIFIFSFNLGVKGAAIATTIAQAVSAIWVFAFLTGKKTRLKIKATNLPIKKNIIFPTVALGLSPFVMQSTESILNICFNVSLKKYGGDLAVGAMTILSSVFTLFTMPLQGICQGGQPIISYNYGAGKLERVKKAIKIQFIICVTFTVLCWLISQLLPQMLISIFNSEPQLMEITTWSMRVYTFGLFLFGMQVSCQQSFIALGKAKISLFLACLRKIILLIPLIFILPQFINDKVFAVFLAEPIADISASIITGITFLTIIKKEIRKPSSALK